MVDVDLAQHVLRWSYLLVFLAMIAESTLVAGLVLPGMAVMFVAAFLAGTGELQVGLVALSALAGTLVGDNLGYGVGRFAGRWRRIEQVSERFHATRTRLSEGYPWHYHLFQFPMPLRVAFPILVGSMRQRWSRWLVFDLVASTVFVSTLTTIGYVVGRLGRSLGFADGVLANLNYVLLSAFGMWLVVTLFDLGRRHLARRGDAAAPAVPH